MLSLAINLLTAYPHLAITFCCMPAFRPFIEDEITQTHEATNEVRERIRVVSIEPSKQPQGAGEAAGGDPRFGAQMRLFQAGLPDVLKGVLDRATIRGNDKEEEEEDGFRVMPSSAVIDVRATTATTTSPRPLINVVTELLVARHSTSATTPSPPTSSRRTTCPPSACLASPTFRSTPSARCSESRRSLAVDMELMERARCVAATLRSTNATASPVESLDGRTRSRESDPS